MQRRNIIRYVCLTQVMVLRDISMRVRKRFPNLEAVKDAGKNFGFQIFQKIQSLGYLLQHEKQQFESLKSDHPKYWVPIQWAMMLVNEVRRQGKFEPGGDAIISVSRKYEEAIFF